MAKRLQNCNALEREAGTVTTTVELNSSPAESYLEHHSDEPLPTVYYTPVAERHKSLSVTDNNAVTYRNQKKPIHEVQTFVLPLA